MTTAIVTEAKLEGAMNYLANSDDTYAAQKAAMENAEILRKRIRARVFLVTEGTVAERQATAETSGETATADEDYIAALKAFETTRARRQRAELIVDVWRSLEASRRKA